MASHRESDHDAFTKVCDALEHQSQSDTTVITQDQGSRGIHLIFYYPVVVLQGEMMLVTSTKGSLEIEPAGHVQYERSIVTRDNRRTYLIDVVTEAYFPTFVAILEEELSRISIEIGNREQQLLASIVR
jgi:hypothetical protein